MPSWLIWGLTAVLILASIMVVWTWIQAFLNYRAVKGDRKLEAYTMGVLLRESAVMVSIVALTLVAVLTIPGTREMWMRIFIRYLLIVMALGLAGVSFHDYQDMKEQLGRD